MRFVYLLQKNIPNLLTIGNLLSGLCSIIAMFEGYPVWAGVFIFIAACFDFLDGLMARLLKAYSDIGKQLDSLADLISFGVAPAFIVFSFFKSVLLITHIEADDITIGNIIILVVPLMLVIFSAIRLAKFNIDERQTTDFIGLPTPANALFFAWLPIMLSQYSLAAFFIILNLRNLLMVTLIHSFLLVLPLPFFSLKFKNLSWKENKWRYVFLILSIMIILVLKYYSIPLVIWLYIVMAIIRYFIKNSNY